MIQITSKELNNREPIRFGEQTGTLDLYDGLTTPFSSDVVVLTEDHISQIEDFVELSAANYSNEATLVQLQYGLPSLVTRVDCTVGVDGNILPYEMEDSPSGQGITDVLHKAAGAPGLKQILLGHFEDMLDTVPTVIVSNSRSHGTDDALIVGEDRYVNIGHNPDEIRTDSPVVVKAIPGRIDSREPYMRLRSQAVAPLVTEGDKLYAERIGLLRSVSSAADLLRDGDNLSSQVVKARLGSMALGVSIYLSAEDRKRFGKSGTVTASRLERDLEAYKEHSGALVQEFIPPIQIENDQDRTNAILRVFTLLGRQQGKITARAIGGCYVARNEVLLHGASNAVSGAILVQ